MTVKEYFTKLSPTMETIQGYLKRYTACIIDTYNNKKYLSDNCGLMKNKSDGSNELVVIRDALLIGSNQIINEVLIRWDYIVSIEEYNMKPKEGM